MINLGKNSDYLTAMQEKIYNLSYLKELSSGDLEFENSMISYFVSNTPKVIDTIDQLLDETNWKQIREEIHRYIPNLNMVGASGLLDDANSIENYTETGKNLDKVPYLWAGLKKQCYSLVKQLSEDFEINFE